MSIESQSKLAVCVQHESWDDDDDDDDETIWWRRWKSVTISPRKSIGIASSIHHFMSKGTKCQVPSAYRSNTALSSH